MSTEARPGCNSAGGRTTSDVGEDASTKAGSPEMVIWFASAPPQKPRPAISKRSVSEANLGIEATSIVVAAVSSGDKMVTGTRPGAADDGSDNDSGIERRDEQCAACCVGGQTVAIRKEDGGAGSQAAVNVEHCESCAVSRNNGARQQQNAPSVRMADSARRLRKKVGEALRQDKCIARTNGDGGRRIKHGEIVVERRRAEEAGTCDKESCRIEESLLSDLL